MQNTELVKISAIVAMGENRVIGNNNQLPWHLPADLKHFKQITTGKPILMGRKTYISIGRPLPNRTNIVLTRDSHFHAPGCKVVGSLEEAIAQARILETQEIFIIGGAEVYKQCLDKIERIYLTVIHQVFEGDTLFPELKQREWREVEKVDFEKDAANVYNYSFLVLERV